MLKDSTAVIGLGLGGMTVTYEFQERNYLTYSVNGSEQDIKSIPNAKNSMRLEGYDGLAGNRELAYGALKGNKHILKKLKEIEKKINIVIASAGGSTGSGCIPFVSDILVQNLDKIVVPVILMPRQDESIQKRLNAYNVAKELMQIEELGAIIDTDVSMPHTKYGVPAYYILASSEASSNLQRYDGIRYGFRATDAKTLEEVYVKSRTQGFGDEVKRRIMLGTFSLSAGFYDAYFNKAAKIRTLIAQDFANVLKDHDLIMGPTGANPAFEIGSEIADPKTMYMNDILTVPVNMAGLPAMSLPAGFDNGLPVGLHIIGKAFDEQTIYNAGYVFEQTTDFHKQMPKLGGQD